MAILDRTCASAVRHLLFPLQERWKGHSTLRLLTEMQVEQWLPLDRLLNLQEQRLHRLIQNAYEMVPFYRKLFGSLGLVPADIQNVSDLEKLPLLDKHSIRENLEELKSSAASRIQRFNTGGSTGQPLTFYLGPTRISSDVAARMRAEAWWGLGIGDREIVIWGSPLEINKQDRLRAMRDRLMRTRLLSAFEISPATMAAYLDEIEAYRPARIFGYGSSIYLLCRYAQQEQRDLRRLGVKTIFVTAEYLWDDWRETISATFGCAVANGYGGRDSGFIAHECPAGGMHITADRLIVEIVGDTGQALRPGNRGEIVVTHLDTPESPLIRYATGDVGAIGQTPCSCGRTLPLLEGIEGRKTDFIVAPDGRLLHGLAVVYILREISGIDQFRIVQKALTEFEVDIVRGAGFDPACEERIRSTFATRLRSPVTVKIRYVPHIAASASGKYRYVVSEVRPPLQAAARS